MTGSIPRPLTAKSVGFDVDTSAPRSSISRDVVVRTPPAEYVPRPLSITIDSKSVTARLYPYVDEFEILSEMVANREAFAAKPATLAFKEEEIDIRKSLSASDNDVTSCRLNRAALTSA